MKISPHCVSKYKLGLLMGALLFVSTITAQDINVSVQNSIKLGDLAGNRKIEFGVKNIIEELLQEKGYALNPTSKNIIFAELIYMDILKTKSNLSVFHKDNTDVVIRIKGYTDKDGKKSKPILVEGSASEVSISTILVGVDGKLNQQNLSTAIKKACYELIEKINP
jgi:hypothetical protein